MNAVVGPTPRLVQRPRLVLAGMSFHGNPFTSHAGWTEENEIGRLWSRLMAYLETAPEVFRRAAVGYELHVGAAQSSVDGEFEVFTGFEMPGGESGDLLGLPVELAVKVVPAGLYAEVDLRVDQMTADDPIMERWMRETGHRESGPFVLMGYDERYRGVDDPEQSVLTLWVPVRPTGDDAPS